MQFLTSSLHYLVPFIIVISIVVFVHEFGHYWIARRCGVRVLSFSIGFGPALFKWKDKHGTDWQIACLPLGGYVKMFGDADPASSPSDEVKTMTEEEKKVSFFHQNVNKRMAIVFAGPAFNYLFAVVVLAILFMVQGQPFSPPVIGTVIENGAAAKAGFATGDRVLSLDGETVSRFEDIKRIVSLNQGSLITAEIQRGEQTLSLPIMPEVSVQKDRFGGEHRLGRIGVGSSKIDYVKWPVHKALVQAARECWTMSVDTVKALGQMIAGQRGSEEIGGPIRIAEMSGNVAKDGGWALLWFMAVISVNLGLINLFPVPLLDGGHLMFYAYERVFGRPMNEKVQDFGMRIGLGLIASLMLFATWNDLVHLEVFSKILSLFS